MHQSPVEQVLFLREAGAVRRLHTVRTLHQQTLAEHSWGVAMLVRAVRPNASAELLYAALVHDLHEWWTGDVPAPCKWAHPAIEHELRVAERAFDAEHGIAVELSDGDRAVLKWCDHAELALYAYERRILGDRSLVRVERNIMRALKYRETPPECVELALSMSIQGVGDA